MCLLSLCSRSCLHSALIDEVVATFTRTLIEARQRKPFNPSTLDSSSTFTIFFSSVLLDFSLCAPYVSFSAPYFFLHQFNELLCWHDISVFMCLHVASFCPHYIAFSAIVQILSSPHRPVSLLSNLRPLRPQCYLDSAYFIHFSCAFFSSPAFSYLLRAHIVQRVIFNFRYV